MQYNYVFANGEKSCVEVSAGMLAALQAEDRLERNNEQKNSRRAGRFVRLEAALSCLPDSQRRLVQAVYFEGVGVTEYARREGVSQPAVSQRLQAAKKKLREILSGPYI